MSAIIAWILKNPWLQTVGCAIFFALSVWLLFVSAAATKGRHDAERATAQAVKRADKADAALKLCNADLTNAANDLKAQSAAVDLMAQEARRAQDQGRRALDAAKAASRQTDREIARALNMQPKSGDVCEQAAELETFLRGAQ